MTRHGRLRMHSAHTDVSVHGQERAAWELLGYYIAGVHSNGAFRRYSPVDGSTFMQRVQVTRDANRFIAKEICEPT